MSAPVYEERLVSGHGANGVALVEITETTRPEVNVIKQASSAYLAASASEADTAAKIREARLKGYEGDPCTNCGAFTLVRNGVCLKCQSCGETSGCS
jgi:ribonucleoside-diphosphate reductase alpha chain